MMSNEIGSARERFCASRKIAKDFAALSNVCSLSMQQFTHMNLKGGRPALVSKKKRASYGGSPRRAIGA